MTEFITIRIARYRDPAGFPTCAANFYTGAVCKFYMTQRNGSNETCLIAGDKSGRYWESLNRRGDEQGSLEPLKDCPVWAVTEKIDFPPAPEDQK